MAGLAARAAARRTRVPRSSVPGWRSILHSPAPPCLSRVKALRIEARLHLHEW